MELMNSCAVGLWLVLCSVFVFVVVDDDDKEVEDGNAR